MSGWQTNPRPAADAPPQGAAPWWTGPWPAVALGVLCYLVTLAGDFTYDDVQLVMDNPRIRSLANVREIWLSDWWYSDPTNEGVPSPRRDRLYRPLTLFSFAVNYAASGLGPGGYHFVNVGLHSAACGLVWLFALRLTGRRGVAAVAAVLFAVHPVHVEAVANIVGRAEVLSTLGLLGGLIALLPRAGWPSAWRVALAALLFLAALLAKETAICYLPVALIALHGAGRRPRRAWGWLLVAAVLTLPLATYLPLRYEALNHHLIRTGTPGPLLNPLFGADVRGRVLGPLTVLGYYTRLLLAPSTLAADYGMGTIDPRAIDAMTVLGAAAVLAGAIGLTGYVRRGATWRMTATLTAMFAASYVLISNTILLIGVSVAERLMYWPSVPALILVALLAAGLWERAGQPGGNLERLRRPLGWLGVALLAALALRTTLRSLDWRDNRTLFSADAQTFPRNVNINLALATQLNYAASMAIDRGERDALLARAEERLDAAREVYPDFPDTYKLLGQVYGLRGEPRQALAYLHTALQLDPRDSDARRHIAEIEQRYDDSVQRLAELQRRAEREPNNVRLPVQIGQLLLETGQHHAGRLALERAASMAPDDLEVLRLLGRLLILDYEEQRAVELLTKVVERDPNDWESHTNLSGLLAQRDPTGCLWHAQRAYKLKPAVFEVQVNLAEANVAAGKPDEALRLFRAIAEYLPASDPRLMAVRTRIQQLEKK